MIIKMRPDVNEEQLQKVLDKVAMLGCKHHLSHLNASLMVSIGEESCEIDPELFRDSEGVIKVYPLKVELPRTQPEENQ
jgi:hypothetical protein